MTYEVYCQRRATLCNLLMQGKLDAEEVALYMSALACTFAGIPS